LAGEVLDVKLLEPWIARYGDERPALMNIYGITETTVHTTYKRIVAENLKHPDVSPIGIPISDLQAHLFDPMGKPVPDGTPGEIYISGAGLARGYLNRPELTAERFLAGPPRMYRTGDRGVRMPNGDLAYLGRMDDQIKVRGFRIEPREVELCLSVHPQVESAIVSPHDYGDGDIRLVAYIVPRQGLDGVAAEQMLAELGQRAGRELPLHMRPSAYFLVPEIPMTANGKVDREALKKLAAPSQSAAVSASLTPTEQVVAGIWQDILEKKQIGVKDDFFDLGGTSLALIRIFARVNEQFHLALNGSILVEDPTVSCLAHCIDEQLAGAGKLSAAVTPTEKTIVQIWEDILQRKNIGVRDDFFDIGGTSLALIRIFAGVNAHFDLSLNGSILAEEPTVSRLAQCVDAELKDKDQEAQIQAVGRN
jgi:acyl carrier protein